MALESCSDAIANHQTPLSPTAALARLKSHANQFRKLFTASQPGTLDLIKPIGLWQVAFFGPHAAANNFMLKNIQDYALTTPAFQALEQDFSSIEGWLSPYEALALLLLAAAGPGQGAVVELGSFKGRSTAFLAFGAYVTQRGPITAIDHFAGSPEHQRGQFEEVREILETGSTFAVYQRNLQQAGLWDEVRTIKDTSISVAQVWQEPIRLLFLDAEHSYAATERDFGLFAPHVEPGGVVAFHDANNPVWPEVGQFYDDLLQKDQQWRPFIDSDTLRAIIRVAA